MITDPFAANRPHLPTLIEQTEAAQRPALFPADPSTAVEGGELSTRPAELTIRVIGEPVPQGSMIGYVVGRRAIVQPSNKTELLPWRKLVTEAARATARRERWVRLDGAVELGIVFFLERPESAPRRRVWPEKRPDLDKLTRAVGDALTDAAVLHDDARIVHFEVWKRYATGDIPLGARIVVRNGVDADRPLEVLRPVVPARAGGAS